MSNFSEIQEHAFTKENGRVVALQSQKYDDFIMFEGDNNDDDKFRTTSLGNIQALSPLGLLFLSKANMERVQDLIRYEVWQRSGKKFIISEQSPTELLIIMRSMFLQHGKHSGCQMEQQINELYNIVIAWSIPRIIGELRQQQTYFHDLEHLPVPIDRPVSLSSAGTRTLRSVTTTF